MARYDYRCTSCGKVFEVEHGMLEHPEVMCPNCGAPAEKVFSTSGIEFKGSGFYNTDQRGGGSSTSATSGAEKAAGEKKAETTGAAASGHSCENCPHKDK